MALLTHAQIWAAIDALAARHDLSPSGLARAAGLDATSFNKSKRQTAEGRRRWPSTESLAKVLEATGDGLDDFVELVAARGGERRSVLRPIPLIGLAQAGDGGYFDDAGFPVGGGWERINFPEVRDENAYALEVAGDSMLPLYRAGDILIVSPNTEVRRGDRVIVRTRDGEVLVKVLTRQTPQLIELLSLNPEHPSRRLDRKDIDWMARVIWASQ